MLLTKDNLLRYVREKKFVTPTTVSEVFDTSTMIASAALSGLSKEKHISITFLKLSSSPYYYDPKQKEALAELGEKHYKGIDKEVFKHLKEQQLIADHSLTVPQRMVIESLKDFAIPLEISHDSKKMIFWVWYLRDLVETKKQISGYLKGNDTSKPETKSTKTITKKKPQESKQQLKKAFEEVAPLRVPEPKKVPEFDSPSLGFENDQTEDFIENFLRKNYLKIEEKDKQQLGTLYSTVLKLNKLQIYFDCMHFFKKPLETDIIKFYTSSMRPKIVFVENAPKKLFKLAENLENLEIVNI